MVQTEVGNGNESNKEKCPIDHNSISAKTWLSLEKNIENPKDEVKKCPIDHNSESAKTWLNLGQSNKEESSINPRLQDATKTINLENKCPIDHSKLNEEDKAKLKSHYYDQLNPKNLMHKASELNQPALNQHEELSTKREISSIPRTEEEDGEKNWVYPSQQMFFNAMQRKSWKPKEEDMKVIVPIHNMVNERAWYLILKYEEMYKDICPNPTLTRFQGRPNDLTPKAKFKGLLGYTLPFDRHDWYINRCGKEVRYVIDFYTGKPNTNNLNMPSFYLDARPALDSVENVYHRMRMFFSNWI